MKGSRTGIRRTDQPTLRSQISIPGFSDPEIPINFGHLALAQIEETFYLHDGHRPNSPDHVFYHLC